MRTENPSGFSSSCEINSKLQALISTHLSSFLPATASVSAMSVAFQANHTVKSLASQSQQCLPGKHPHTSYHALNGHLWRLLQILLSETQGTPALLSPWPPGMSQLQHLPPGYNFLYTYIFAPLPLDDETSTAQKVYSCLSAYVHKGRTEVMEGRKKGRKAVLNKCRTFIHSSTICFIHLRDLRRHAEELREKKIKS